MVDRNGRSSKGGGGGVEGYANYKRKNNGLFFGYATELRIAMMRKGGEV